jgi:hypothetical protein
VDTRRPTLLAELLAILVDRFGAGDVEHALVEAREQRASRRRRAAVARSRSAEIAKQAASLVSPDELARARARRALKE